MQDSRLLILSYYISPAVQENCLGSRSRVEPAPGPLLRSSGGQYEPEKPRPPRKGLRPARLLWGRGSPLCLQGTTLPARCNCLCGGMFLRADLLPALLPLYVIGVNNVLGRSRESLVPDSNPKWWRQNKTWQNSDSSHIWFVSLSSLEFCWQ